MEPLGTSIEEPTIRETWDEFQKTIDVLMSDDEERKRSESTDRTVALSRDGKTQVQFPYTVRIERASVDWK